MKIYKTFTNAIITLCHYVIRKRLTELSYFSKILCKKKSEVASMLIYLPYYVSNIGGLLQKFHFPVEVVLNFLQTQRDLEVVFRPQFL